MYARSTTFDTPHAALDVGIGRVRDQLMPAVLDVEACVGLSLLVDPASGRCVLTTAWRSKEAMQDAADRLRPVSDRLADVLDGPADDEEWEIAVLHRDHPSGPGTCVRTVRMQVEPDRLAHSVDLYRMVLLPQIEEFDGFCSVGLMVDRACGHAVSSVAFDSREAMRQTRNLAAVVREGATHEASGEILDVAEFDLALAHLHVPDLV